MDPKEKLLRLISDELPETTEQCSEFCNVFEPIFSFELEKSCLSEAENFAFQQLFDVLVWYSPYPKERKEIPHYRGEGDVRDAILRARSLLNTEDL